MDTLPKQDFYTKFALEVIKRVKNNIDQNGGRYPILGA